MTPLLHTLTWATTVRDPKHMSPIEFAFTGALVGFGAMAALHYWAGVMAI